MEGRFNYQIKWDQKLEKHLRNSEFLGKGHNGIVYLLKNRKILKIFSEEEVCAEEYDILRRASKTSKHFPKVFGYKKNYIIREFVDGVPLDKYLEKNGFNENLGRNLVNLILEFKKLKFTRVDIRCKDLYVQKDMSLMVIDPKHQFTKHVDYPRHLMKGIYNIGLLADFLKYVRKFSPENFKFWSESINRYLIYRVK